MYSGRVSDRYRVVQLANGEFSLRSEAYRETFHPVVGPTIEAQSLYVDQLELVRRVKESNEEFVVWDVGLGGAANPLTFLTAVRHVARKVRIVSFDYTTEPLRCALENVSSLKYLSGWETPLSTLLEKGSARFEESNGISSEWELHLGDFPSRMADSESHHLSRPHAIFYDAFSPATNPAMWTLEVFTRLFEHLDPARPCSMPTYSRSTLLRVTLLLAGFFVGKGHATGEKEETTIASNAWSHLKEPLDRAWLLRAKRSRSAEPLHEPRYQQSPLADETWERLRAHPQFA